MDKLKSKIQESIQRDETGYELPGHRERFEQKLLTKKKGQFFGPGNPLWLYAMAASLLVLVGLFSWNWSRESRQYETTEMASLPYEFTVMEKYFEDQIQQYSDLTASEDSLVQRYLIDLKQLELEQKELELKLNENIRNEHIIEAIISHYKRRLEIMERLRRYIKLKNQHDTSLSNYKSI